MHFWTNAVSTRTVAGIGCLAAVLIASWCVGILDRGYWTPDEPREADISWRMSWQTGKAVPQLAGVAFCEKPPFAYWAAGASIKRFGVAAWAARLPNLLYALITALSVCLLARRSSGPIAGLAAGAAISTFLLTYQVEIWLATDAPLLAAVSAALLGEFVGFYADTRGERLRGYLLMHAALAVGFLSKSAAAWMVPALAFLTLVVWERRWKEFLRFELYVGLIVQAAVILTWVWFVYSGDDGPAHLKVFFWNNLIGRFTSVAAPADLQYATGHRNAPGKYLIELPIYLWPWTLLVAAALWRAWRSRRGAPDRRRAVRFALAIFLPTLAILSIAATARNIYLAPALPGLALLLGWWAAEASAAPDRWDLRALRATALLLLVAAFAAAAAVALIGYEDWDGIKAQGLFIAVAAAGIAAAGGFSIYAWRTAARGRVTAALYALLLAYGALLVLPASQAYRQVDRWQDFAAIGGEVRADIGSRPLLLFAPDETTQAWVDVYTRTAVARIDGPEGAAAVAQMMRQLARAPRSLVLVQLPGRAWSPRLRALARRIGWRRFAAAPHDAPPWLSAVRLQIVERYALPNGRRYALLAPAP